MWSHYAKSHIGLCVEFSRSQYLRFALKVQYVEEYPTLDLFKAMDDMHMQRPSEAQARYVVDCVYLSKAGDWKYENEWRLLAYASLRSQPIAGVFPPDLMYGGKGLHDFPSNLITRVFLSCRMTAPGQRRGDGMDSSRTRQAENL